MEEILQVVINDCRLASPLLSELLTSKIEPQEFKFQCISKLRKLNDNEEKTYKNEYIITSNDSSKNLGDYFEINGMVSDSTEQLGSDNSLFLAVARALIYKRTYENNNHYHSNMFSSEGQKLESDNRIQRVLRINLCRYWLKSIEKSNFLSKYLM